MSDKQLRAANRKSKLNASKANERNKIWNEAVAAEFKERKPKGTVNFSQEALTKTEERHGKKLAEDDFYDTDNPKAESKKAIQEARKTEEYQSTIDDIIAAQNREWIQGNKGVAKADQKHMTLTRKREIIEEYIDNNDLTLAERVAASDMYNENTDRMFRGTKSSKGKTKEEKLAKLYHFVQ